MSLFTAVTDLLKIGKGAETAGEAAKATGNAARVTSDVLHASETGASVGRVGEAATGGADAAGALAEQRQVSAVVDAATVRRDAAAGTHGAKNTSLIAHDRPGTVDVPHAPPRGASPLVSPETKGKLFTRTLSGGLILGGAAAATNFVIDPLVRTLTTDQQNADAAANSARKGTVTPVQGGTVVCTADGNCNFIADPNAQNPGRPSALDQLLAALGLAPAGGSNVQSLGGAPPDTSFAGKAKAIAKGVLILGVLAGGTYAAVKGVRYYAKHKKAAGTPVANASGGAAPSKSLGA